MAINPISLRVAGAAGKILTPAQLSAQSPAVLALAGQSLKYVAGTSPAIAPSSAEEIPAAFGLDPYATPPVAPPPDNTKLYIGLGLGGAALLGLVIALRSRGG